MKIKLTKYAFAVLAITFALTSCSKNSDELATIVQDKTTEGYVVKDGYIKFNSIKDYQNLYEKISKLSEKDLDLWNKSLPFKSLEIKYKEDSVETYILENCVADDLNYQLNTKRVNETLSSLYNEKGIMMINDTIFKIKDEYLFTVTNGDFALVDKIDKNIKFKSDNVLKQKHTIELAKTENPDELEKTISDQTVVFYVASNRREFVTFEAYISGGYINFDLRGHWQRLFVFWLTPAADELVYGEISVSGTIGKDRYGNDNIINDDVRLDGTQLVNWNYSLGNPLAVFDLNVTYSYKKNSGTAYINKWLGTPNGTEGTFSKHYPYILF
ncbi:MAG: hypothetical protein ACYC25_02910 [Paludibacter sp.]